MFAALYFKKGKYSRQTPKTKAAGIAALSLCAALALGSGFLMVRDLCQYSESAGAYDDLAGLVELPERTETPEDMETGTAPIETEPAGSAPSVVLPMVDLNLCGKAGRTSSGGLPFPIR